VREVVASSGNASFLKRGFGFSQTGRCILPVLPFYDIKVINLQKSDKEIQIHKIYTMILLTSKDAGRPLRSGEAGVFV
jgi:hypothetical protein